MKKLLKDPNHILDYQHQSQKLQKSNKDKSKTHKIQSKNYKQAQSRQKFVNYIVYCYKYLKFFLYYSFLLA